jgi:hypothetical protein
MTVSPSPDKAGCVPIELPGLIALAKVDTAALQAIGRRQRFQHTQGFMITRVPTGRSRASWEIAALSTEIHPVVQLILASLSSGSSVP